MKKSLLFLMIVVSQACMSSRDYVVGYDYSYYGNFKKYKTYTFIDHNNADKLTSQNSPVIEDEIKFRMKILGYEYTQNKPDLLISFKIFETNFNFKGYNQPGFKEWVTTEDTTKNYDPIKYELRNGTLLILLNDRKKKTTAWQGYASGIKSETNLVHPRILKNSIMSIFDQYEMFANSIKSKEEKD